MGVKVESRRDICRFVEGNDPAEWEPRWGGFDASCEVASYLPAYDRLIDDGGSGLLDTPCALRRSSSR